MGMVTKSVSLEEYLSDPAYELFEYIDGHPVELNVGTVKHSKAQANCAWVLKDYFRRHAGGYVASGLRCRVTVGEDSRFFLPDVAVVLGELSEPPFLDRAPDMIVEIRSPGETVAQQVRKVVEYLSGGARLGWLILPEERSVIILRHGTTPRTVVAGETIDGGDLLPDLKFPVEDLFA